MKKYILILFTVTSSLHAPPKFMPLQFACDDLSKLEELEEDLERLSISPTSPKSNAPFAQKSALTKEEQKQMRRVRAKRIKVYSLIHALLIPRHSASDTWLGKRTREDEMDCDNKRSKSVSVLDS